jgi:hypothetical protein
MTRTFAVAALTGTALTLTALPGAPAQAGMSAMAPAAPVAAQGDASLIEKVGRRGRHVGRGVAIGAGIVTLGVLGAIAASKARERDYDRYEDRGYRYRDNCRRWRHWCRRGDDRACWKFDTRC